ncbi:MAG: hypothetical protein RL717_68 [Pseudomonadota bacterium]
MAEEKSEVFRSNAPQEVASAEGKDKKRAKPAEGPAPELRELHDHHATGTAGVGELGEVEIARHDGNAEALKAAEAAEATAATAPDGEPVTQSVPEPEPELFFKPGEEAVPWALALHLEERIKSLGVKTAEVNRELDTLEAASAKLKKRMAL